MPVKYIDGDPNWKISTPSTKEEIDQYWYEEQQRRKAGKHTGTVGISARVLKAAMEGRKAGVKINKD